MRTVDLAALLAIVCLAACSSSSSSSGAPVIDSVSADQGKKGADGRWAITLIVTAHDDGAIASARIDFPSSDPPSIVGNEVAVGKQQLSSSPIQFSLDPKAGPGTGDANLVLTDDQGNVAKKKMTVTLMP